MSGRDARDSGGRDRGRDRDRGQDRGGRFDDRRDRDSRGHDSYSRYGSSSGSGRGGDRDRDRDRDRERPRDRDDHRDRERPRDRSRDRGDSSRGGRSDAPSNGDRSAPDERPQPRDDDHPAQAPSSSGWDGKKEAENDPTWARIYISNLPTDVTSDELQELFGSLGVVAREKQKRGYKDQWPFKIKIYTDDGGLVKGDAVLTYEDANAARSAPNFFNGHEIRGNKIKVELAGKPEPPAGGWAGGGGGGFGGGRGRGGGSRYGGGGGGYGGGDSRYGGGGGGGFRGGRGDHRHRPY